MAKKQTTKESSNAVKPAKSSSATEPDSMEALLAEYGAVQSLSRGTKIEGTVLRITPKQVVVDIGGKSEGIVAEKAYQEAKDFIRDLKVGDKVKASVIIPETYDGITILSFRHTAQDATWEAIDEAVKNDTTLMVVGRNLNQSGITADFKGLTGFVPISHIGSKMAKNPEGLVNRQFEVKVIESDRDTNKVVFSEKHVSDSAEIELMEKAMKKLSEDEVYAGRVTAVTNFGCFVAIEVPLGKKEKGEIEGLVHISELSWDKVANASDVVHEGDSVKVKVLGKEKGKLSLSMKAALSDPWDTLSKKYKKDAKVTGTVSKMSDYGLFVKLEDGIEGLVHMTKIPPGKKFADGESVNVYVEDIDTKKKNISLGLVLTAKPVGYR